MPERQSPQCVHVGSLVSTGCTSENRRLPRNHYGEAEDVGTKKQQDQKEAETHKAGSSDFRGHPDAAQGHEVLSVSPRSWDQAEVVRGGSQQLSDWLSS